MSRFKLHVFVCTNERPVGARPACAAGELIDALQAGVAQNPSLWDHVAITATGCLGPCFDGPTMVVYPEGIWYAGVRPGDATEIVREHLLAGRPVERLRYHWPEGPEGPGGPERPEGE